MESWSPPAQSTRSYCKGCRYHDHGGENRLHLCICKPRKEDERLGPVCLPRLKEAAEGPWFFYQQQAVGCPLEIRWLPPLPILNSAPLRGAKIPIARAVCKIICFHCMPGLSCELPAFNSLDSVAFHLQILQLVLRSRVRFF